MGVKIYVSHRPHFYISFLVHPQGIYFLYTVTAIRSVSCFIAGLATLWWKVKTRISYLFFCAAVFEILWNLLWYLRIKSVGTHWQACGLVGFCVEVGHLMIVGRWGCAWNFTSSVRKEIKRQVDADQEAEVELECCCWEVGLYTKWSVNYPTLEVSDSVFSKKY